MYEILNTISDPVFIKDKNNKIIFVNDSLCSFFGKSKSNLIGKHDYNILKIQDISIFTKEDEVLFKNNKKVIQNITIDIKNNIYSIEIHKSIYISKNDEKYIIGIFKEIKSIKNITKNNNDILEGENLFNTILNYIPDLIYIKDRNSKFISANNAMVNHFILSSINDFIGKDDFDFYPYKKAKKLYDDEQKIIKTGKPIVNIEEDIMFPNNIERIILTTKVPFRDKNGKIAGIVGIGRDISDRKTIENLLEKTNENLEKIVRERTGQLEIINKKLQSEILEKQKIANDLEKLALDLVSEKEELSVTLKAIDDGVITTDINGKILLINKSAEKLIAWDSKEVLNKNISDVFNVWNEIINKENILKSFDLSETDEQQNYNSQVILKSKNGTQFLIELIISSVCDNKNNTIGFVFVFRDITEKKKNEIILLRTLKLESLGVLAGGIAHDFNNILTAILGNLSLSKYLLNKDHKVYELLDETEKASEKAKNLTQQLLTLSRGNSPIKITSSIKELINESTELALRGSNVIAEYYIPDNIWNVDIDQGQISQVIQNLVLNARQAMSDGGILSILCSNFNNKDNKKKKSIGEGNYVMISIADTGCGITEEILPNIFDPYFTTKETGHGLGLATTYSIIKNHKGFIEVESKVGRGTMFTFYLPSSDQKIIENNYHSETKLIKNLRILILEDDEVIIKFLQLFFYNFGFVPVFTTDGNETIEIYKNNWEKQIPFDIVLLDLTIPGGMGGKETIKNLIKINPDIKAIVSSGYSNDSVLSEYKKYGFSARISKPYKINELILVIKECFKS